MSHTYKEPDAIVAEFSRRGKLGSDWLRKLVVEAHTEGRKKGLEEAFYTLPPFEVTHRPGTKISTNAVSNLLNKNKRAIQVAIEALQRK